MLSLRDGRLFQNVLEAHSHSGQMLGSPGVASFAPFKCIRTMAKAR